MPVCEAVQLPLHDVLNGLAHARSPFAPAGRRIRDGVEWAASFRHRPIQTTSKRAIMLWSSCSRLWQCNK
jgi:hypothetical protein